MDLPALEELMGGYFHQDWRLDGTESDVLALYVSDHPDLAPRLTAEIDAVLNLHLSEEALDTLLTELGCQRLPGPEVDGYRGWLMSLSQQAQAYFHRSH